MVVDCDNQTKKVMKSALKVTDEKKAVFHSPIPHFHLALVVLAYLKADQPKVWNKLEKVGARVLLSMPGCAYLNQTNPFPSPSLPLTYISFPEHFYWNHMYWLVKHPSSNSESLVWNYH